MQNVVQKGLDMGLHLVERGKPQAVALESLKLIRKICQVKLENNVVKGTFEFDAVIFKRPRSARASIYWSLPTIYTSCKMSTYRGCVLQTIEVTTILIVILILLFMFGVETLQRVFGPSSGDFDCFTR